MNSELKNINKTLNRLVTCFSTEFGDKTLHESLEDIKVINNDIELTLKKIATTLEKQLDHQIKFQNQLVNNLNDKQI